MIGQASSAVSANKCEHKQLHMLEIGNTRPMLVTTASCDNSLRHILMTLTSHGLTETTASCVNSLRHILKTLTSRGLAETTHFLLQIQHWGQSESGLFLFLKYLWCTIILVSKWKSMIFRRLRRFLQVQNTCVRHTFENTFLNAHPFRPEPDAKIIGWANRNRVSRSSVSAFFLMFSTGVLIMYNVFRHRYWGEKQMQVLTI